jgi:hypothetical protein
MPDQKIKYPLYQINTMQQVILTSKPLATSRQYPGNYANNQQMPSFRDIHINSVKPA